MTPYQFFFPCIGAPAWPPCFIISLQRSIIAFISPPIPDIEPPLIIFWQSCMLGCVPPDPDMVPPCIMPLPCMLPDPIGALGAGFCWAKATGAMNSPPRTIAGAAIDVSLRCMCFPFAGRASVRARVIEAALTQAGPFGDLAE